MNRLKSYFLERETQAYCAGALAGIGFTAIAKGEWIVGTAYVILGLAWWVHLNKTKRETK